MNTSVSSTPRFTAVEVPALARSFQYQKNVALGIGVIALGALVVLCSFRFIPPLNDLLSGPFEPLRWISDRLAHETATQVDSGITVATIPGDTGTCSAATGAAPDDETSIVYVVRFSEPAHSLCMTTYALVPRSARGTQVIDLRQAHFYSRSVPGVFAVVPIGHMGVTFPSTYITLLDWRTTPTPALLAKAGIVQFQHKTDFSGPISTASVNLDFNDLRAAIAQRHRYVNTVLDGGCAALLVLVIAPYFALLVQFRRFAARCPIQGRHPFIVFLSTQLPELIEIQQHGQLERLRANIEHQRIERRALAAAQPHPQPVIRESNSIERFDLLLESLKPLCTDPEEFQGYRAEAEQILLAKGFRPARGFIVNLYSQLRERSLSSEEGPEAAE